MYHPTSIPSLIADITVKPQENGRVYAVAVSVKPEKTGGAYSKTSSSSHESLERQAHRMSKHGRN